MMQSPISVPFHLNILITHQWCVKKPLDYCFYQYLLGNESMVLNNLQMSVHILPVTYMLQIQYDYIRDKRINRIWVQRGPHQTCWHFLTEIPSVYARIHVYLHQYYMHILVVCLFIDTRNICHILSL